MVRHDRAGVLVMRRAWAARARARARDEGGFAIIIVALAIVVMLIFAAFAVDLGLVFNERRVDQNSADASATSGAVIFIQAASLQSAVDEIVAKVNTDLGRTVSSAQWVACTDPARPLAYTHTAANMSLSPATPCVSFTAGFDKLRVKLPSQTVDSAFGKVIGISSYQSSAFAEVGLKINGGGALPFVVLASVTQGQQVCLRVDNSGGVEPPDTPPIDPYTTDFVKDPCNMTIVQQANGSRGTLKPYHYVPACDKPSGNQGIVDAIRVGMDHPLGVFTPPVTLAPGDNANNLDSNPGARIDGGNSCTVVFPNTVDVDTGFTAQLLKCALLQNPCASGSTSGPGRLAVSSNSSTFLGLNVNDHALWDYLVANPPSGSCSAAKTLSAGGATFYKKRAALQNCLQNWTSGQLFTEAIADDLRLGYVPKIAELGLCKIQPAANELCSGTFPDNVHINNFVPVYLDGLYQDKGGTCDTNNPATPVQDNSGWAIHYPGKSLKCGTSGGGAQIDRMSGIVIPCGALPLSVCDPSSNPPFPSQQGIIRVQLTR